MCVYIYMKYLTNGQMITDVEVFTLITSSLKKCIFLWNQVPQQIQWLKAFHTISDVSFTDLNVHQIKQL